MKELNIGGKEIKCYTPKELKAHLDEYVIGQDSAKRILSVAIYNHYKRLCVNMNKEAGVKVAKSNICLLGPTGCGKTYMIKTIARYMGLPYYIADATTLTQAGYVGDDVESILVGLIRSAGGNLGLASIGIVIIDEIDKLAKRGSNEHISRDVVGEGVQQALLKMVEGDVVGVPPAEGRKHPDQQLNYINTSNILFIGAGAFSGIEDIVRKRSNPMKVGFDASHPVDSIDMNPYESVSQEDLRKFGLIPEFIGRFPVIASINPLSEEALAKILVEPKDSLVRQYTAMFSVDDIKLHFEEPAIKKIASTAVNLKTGARGLRSIMECVMNDFIYEYGGSDGGDLTITLEDVERSIENRYGGLASA